jgi:general secretion pathway protein D
MRIKTLSAIVIGIILGVYIKNITAQEAPLITPNVAIAQQADVPQPGALDTISIPEVPPGEQVGVPVPGVSPAEQIEEKPKAPVGELQQIKDNKDLNSKEPADIFLNFESASLASVVNYLAEQKKANIIPDKDLEAAKVSLSTREPLTLERAWNIMLTLLELNGFSMIKVGNIYRIVKSAGNGFEPLPTYSSETGTSPEKLPDNDMIVRYIYFFKNIKPEMAQNILKGMLDDKGVMINTDLNACIIKEQSINIKTAMKILQELDSGGLRQQIKIIPLRYTNAAEVKKTFDEILEKSGESDKVIRFSPTTQKESTYFSSSTKIIPDPIKNTLILLGTEKDLDKITDFIYKFIDVPFGSTASRIHIKEIHYAKAENLKGLLENIIAPPKGASEKSTVMGEYKLFDDVIISAEKGGEDSQGAGNRLIIACNRDDWKRLENLIDQLDNPQPQIAIEVMIINVGINQDKYLGAQTYGLFRGKKDKKLGLGIHEIESWNLSTASKETAKKALDSDSDKSKSNVDAFAQQYINMAEGSNGNPTFLTIGKAGSVIEENIWSIIKCYFNLDNSNIVAQPFLIANNNTPKDKCFIDMTYSKRLPGEAVANTVGISRTKVEQKDATISVKLGPRINKAGCVDMDLEVNVTEFDENAQGGAATVKREFKTTCKMLAGEVLVLGGLTKSSLNEGIYKTPILGDIPILGNLFKTKSRKREETNLYVFLRPSIIKPRFEGGADEYSQLKLDYAKYQFMKNDTYSKDRDPIQHWFFKPSKQSVKEKLSDWKHGVFRPIDKYAYGQGIPIEVNIREDPYYRVSEMLAKKKLARAEYKKKKGMAKKKALEVSTIKLD